MLEEDIIDGKYDHRLDNLIEAIHERRKFLQRRRRITNQNKLSEGDRVKLVNVSPKTMNDARGTMKRSSNGKLGIQLDHNYRRFNKDLIYHWPLECYERLDSEATHKSTVQYDG